MAGVASGNSKLTAELVLSSPLSCPAMAAHLSKVGVVLAGINKFSAA